MPVKRRARATAVGTILTLLIALFSVDYTVERGDTLGKIAKEKGVSLTDLIEVNDIDNPNLIFPGQVLVIPGEDDPDEIHVVVRGETLSRIAAAYGTSVAVLAEVNQLANPDLIRIGQNLIVRSTGSAPESPPGSSEEPGSSTGGSAARSGRSHIVSGGETLESIAAKYGGVSADSIAKANGIVNHIIYTGTRLFLDGPELVATGAGGEITYTVKRGDRLGDIAAVNGTTVSRIAQLNDIANVNLIRSGQELRIPSGSTWVCPVSGGRFFNDWGFPRGGGSRYHEGNDIFAPFRAPVVAPVSGTVDFVVGSIGGHQFTLHGDDGIEYLGSHMDGFARGNGRVSAGETLGYIGSSGNAEGTRPHLHFGMYMRGDAFNPYPTLLANGCK